MLSLIIISCNEIIVLAELLFLALNELLARFVMTLSWN